MILVVLARCENRRVPNERVSDGPGRPLLEGERLRLEPVLEAHLNLFVTLNSDAEVMRFILGRGATVEETRQEWVQRLGPRTDDARGLGYWAGFTAAGAFLGWWGASAFCDDRTRAGLGYRLMRSAWGAGYATEGARLMMDQASKATAVEPVVASTMSVNVGSRRVLEKVGMRRVDTYLGEWRDPLPGWEQGEVVYEAQKSDGRRDRAGEQSR